MILSSLGKQCEILSIKVENYLNIIQLVKEMPKLRSLNAEYQSDDFKFDYLRSTTDGLIRWLQHQLPLTSVIT